MTQRKPPRRAPRPVGGGSGARQMPGMLMVGAAALAASLLFLVFVVASACNDNTPSSSSPGTATATPPASTTGPGSQPTQPGTTSVPNTPVASATTGSTPATGTATATVSPTDDGILLGCNDILVPLDKQHHLGPDCAPNDLVDAGNGQQLRREPASAFADLVAAAGKAGLTIQPASGFRSYQNQVDVYNSAVQGFGKEYADRTSARPGHSEHQLGTTMDISTPALGGALDDTLGQMPEGKWLAANAYKYGFIISYPDGTEAITGYAYEPWHIRYVGKDVAAQVNASGKTLHEFLLK